MSHGYNDLTPDQIAVLATLASVASNVSISVDSVRIDEAGRDERVAAKFGTRVDSRLDRDRVESDRGRSVLL